MDDVACTTCGYECHTPTLPSGMHFPRHNVPQYMGNAVWDARGAIDLETAVRAMLGDPFAYTRSVNLELIMRALRGESKGGLVDAFDPNWPLDERYIGYQWSWETRVRLFDALRRNFDRSYLLESAVWAQLPGDVRQQLEETPPAELPEESALCAAALLMDLDSPTSSHVGSNATSHADGDSESDIDRSQRSAFNASPYR